MPAQPRIHSGDRFGLLTAIDRVRGDNGLLLWRFVCDCGNEVINNGQPMLRSQPWRSCGCQRYAYGEDHPQYRHGMRQTRVYRIWNAMRQRCHNPNQPHYVRYGGKGVRVCKKWREDFMAFYKDMGDPPSDKHSIDRINPSGNYEPRNCRWATASQQNRNKRKE
jgi:hypothetical protein